MAAASTAVRPIGHDDRLSLVEHLDELRTRLIVCVATLVVAFAICAWQNKALLDFIGKPLATQTEHRTEAGKGPLGGIYTADKGARAALESNVVLLQAMGHDESTSPALRAVALQQARENQQALQHLPKSPPPNQPVTLGIGEPFTQSITIAAYFALLFSLPLILYQLYAFILPAFSPSERAAVLPLMAMVPVLFIAGVAFGYVVVLPAATKFLQNFNADQFNVLVQAKDYYKFAVLTLVSIGVVFQLPVGILAATRIGLITVKQLRAWRRYAIVATAVLAMILPGTDPVSMLFEFAILYALYELSLVMATVTSRRSAARTLVDADAGADDYPG
jgi:sec-independent protein translocase protein TatC